MKVAKITYLSQGYECRSRGLQDLYPLEILDINISYAPIFFILHIFFLLIKKAMSIF